MVDNEKLRTLGLVGLGLVHELNTPLTTVALSLELLLDALDTEPPPTETVRARVAENLARVQRMAALIRRFRALAQGAPSQREAVGLASLVDNSVRLVRATLQELTGTPIEVRPPDPGSAPHAVEGDPVLLEQALLCLLLNAADAGTRVTLSTGEADGVVWIHVDDDGPGFSAAPTLGGSTKGSGGMGVGLPLVELIARDAGGQLILGAAPGGGARASLGLRPASSAPSQPARSSAP